MNTVHAPRRLESKFLAQEREWQFRSWKRIGYITLAILFVTVTALLVKHVWVQESNRVSAWFRFEGDGDTRQTTQNLVGVEIGGRKIPASKLSQAQKEEILRNYEFAGWIGHSEKFPK